MRIVGFILFPKVTALIYIYIYIYRERERDSKSPQVSWTFLSILPDLTNAIIWIVSMDLPIFNSSSSLSKPLDTVLSTPIATHIIDILMFHLSIQDVALMTYRKRWTIEKGGWRVSGRSALVARHDDNDDACHSESGERPSTSAGVKNSNDDNNNNN